MTTYNKIIIITVISVLLAAALSLFASTSQAGMFLDLDLATPINNYTSTDCAPSGTALVTPLSDGSYHVELDCKGGHYLGDTGTLGIVRIGYQTGSYELGPVGISAHVYYQHMSDWRVGDGGLDVIAAGVRIQ